MPNANDAAAALKTLQNDIYRGKIVRARGLTMEQRLDEVFELSNHQFGMMLAGAMHRLGTRGESEGWDEVRRWMERLDRARDHAFYVTDIPPID